MICFLPKSRAAVQVSAMLVYRFQLVGQAGELARLPTSRQTLLD
jgi:hypothetical protein